MASGVQGILKHATQPENPIYVEVFEDPVDTENHEHTTPHTADCSLIGLVEHFIHEMARKYNCECPHAIRWTTQTHEPGIARRYHIVVHGPPVFSLEDQERFFTEPILDARPRFRINMLPGPADFPTSMDILLSIPETTPEQPWPRKSYHPRAAGDLYHELCVLTRHAFPVTSTHDLLDSNDLDVDEDEEEEKVDSLAVAPPVQSPLAPPPPSVPVPPTIGPNGAVPSLVSTVWNFCTRGRQPTPVGARPEPLPPTPIGARPDPLPSTPTGARPDPLPSTPVGARPDPSPSTPVGARPEPPPKPAPPVGVVPRPLPNEWVPPALVYDKEKFPLGVPLGLTRAHVPESEMEPLDLQLVGIYRTLLPCLMGIPTPPTLRMDCGEAGKRYYVFYAYGHLSVYLHHLRHLALVQPSRVSRVEVDTTSKCITVWWVRAALPSDCYWSVRIDNHDFRVLQTQRPHGHLLPTVPLQPPAPPASKSKFMESPAGGVTPTENFLAEALTSPVPSASPLLSTPASTSMASSSSLSAQAQAQALSHALGLAPVVPHPSQSGMEGWLRAHVLDSESEDEMSESVMRKQFDRAKRKRMQERQGSRSPQRRKRSRSPRFAESKQTAPPPPKPRSGRSATPPAKRGKDGVSSFPKRDPPVRNSKSPTKLKHTGSEKRGAHTEESSSDTRTKRSDNRPPSRRKGNSPHRAPIVVQATRNQAVTKGRVRHIKVPAKPGLDDSDSDSDSPLATLAKALAPTPSSAPSSSLWSTPSSFPLSSLNRS
jgi:hypothetical protein